MQIHVLEANQIVVIFRTFSNYIHTLLLIRISFFFKEHLINTAASLTSDDEDEEMDDEDSTEGSADQLLVF